MPVRGPAERARRLARRWIPESLGRRLRGLQRRLGWQRLPVGSVNFGDLKRLDPVSPVFGLDRRLPLIDRYYIERFLAGHAADIRGRVLEVGDSVYTHRFGGDRIERSEVLHYVPGNPQATLVADLCREEQLPMARYDCIIATQTLQMIYEVDSAVRNLHGMLRPGGVLLVTAHGISKIARREGLDPWGEYWHFTAQSIGRLFGQVFGPDHIEVLTYGNVLTACAFLHGLVAEDLSADELDHRDPDFEVIVAVRAYKPVH